MKKCEKTFLKFLDSRIDFIVLFFVIVIGLIVRFCLRNVVSHDMTGYLLKWHKEFSDCGGLGGLDHQVGNYNLLYQFIIALLTYLPINPMYSFKIVSVIFDFMLAYYISRIVYVITTKNENKTRYSIMAFSFIIMSPIVFLNSAAWGQCDAIFSSCCVAALYYLIVEKRIKSFVMLGLAFSFKLQAMFILPFFLFYYVYKKSFSILNFGLIPAMMFVTAIPNIIAGRNVGDIVKVYIGQSGETNAMYSKYPSFWCFLTDKHGGDFEYYYIYKNVAIIFAIFILLLIMYYLYKKLKDIMQGDMLYIAFIMIYTCVLFLPNMQERYGYMYESMSIAVAISNKKTIPLAIILNMMTIYQYGGALGIEMLPIPLAELSWINIVVYIAYIIFLQKRICLKEKEV